jgi:histidinol-phosphate aminotransferase
MSRFFDQVTGERREAELEERSSLSPSQANQRLILLASNESPYGPSPKALAAAQDALADSHRYPDPDSRELRARLAADLEVRPAQIVVSAGSAALLSLIAGALLEPGLNAITAACTFVVYAAATQATGANLIRVPMKFDRLDLEGILAAVTPQTRLVFIANPNNPTGTIVGVDELEAFLERIPAHVFVVLDEAYHDYAEHFSQLRNIPYSRSLDHVRQGRPVVVLRTFSKVHGLAALRIGYGIGPSALMEFVANSQDTFSVSTAAQAAALAALDDVEHVAFGVKQNALQIAWLSEELARLGWRVAPAWGNFLFCEVDGNTGAIVTRLREEGILIRPMESWGALGCVRIAAGTEEENRILVDVLRKLRAE